MSAETVPATAGHVAAAGDELRRLAGEYVDDLARRHPDTATELGDHRFDELLPDRSEAALADERRGLDDFAARLTDLDVAALEPELRVDAALMAGDVARRLFEIEELREHTWNPLLANPGSAIYMLLARDYAPLPDRLHSLAGAGAGAGRPGGRAGLASGGCRRSTWRPRSPSSTGRSRWSRTPPTRRRRAGRPPPRAPARRGGRARRRPRSTGPGPPRSTALAAHRDWLAARLAELSARGPSGRGGRRGRLRRPPARPGAVLPQARADPAVGRRRRRDPGPGRGRPRPDHRGDHPGRGRPRRDAARGARPARRRRPRRGDHPRLLRAGARRPDRLRPRPRPGHGLRRPGRADRHAGDQPGRRGRLLRPARAARAPAAADVHRGLADAVRLAGRPGRLVLPRVQPAHGAQPDGARGDARPLPAARARPPVHRLDPGAGPRSGRARSSRAGRSTPRS